MTPPHSLVDRDAEFALLGLLVREPARFADPRITRLVFADPSYRRIYDVLAAHRVDLAGDPGSAADVLLAQNVPDARSLVSTAVLDMEQFIPDRLIAFCATLAHRRALRALASGLQNVAEHPTTANDDRETLDTIAAQTAAFATTGPGSTPWVRCDTVILKAVTWLWTRRIPFGKLTLLDGDPGLGKTALTIDLAARISTGRQLPDDPDPPYPAQGVVFLNAEDDLADTLVPRLRAAGADLTKIVAFPVEQLPTFPDGITTLRAAIRAVGAALVIIDPLMGLLDAQVDAYRDQDSRRVTKPLAALAAETDTAILLVRHLTKQAGPKALYRGGGSIGWSGAARASLLVAEDSDRPDDPDARVLAPIKNNLSRKADPLRFALAETPDHILRLEWGDHATTTADQLLAPPPTSTDSLTIADAVACLQTLLREGDVDAETADTHRKKHHISSYAWKLARVRLGVRAVKNGTGPWSLHLPDRLF